MKTESRMTRTKITDTGYSVEITYRQGETREYCTRGGYVWDVTGGGPGTQVLDPWGPDGTTMMWRNRDTLAAHLRKAWRKVKADAARLGMPIEQVTI